MAAFQAPLPGRFWAPPDNKSNKAVAFSEVLVDVGISRERYDRYSALVRTVGVDTIQWRGVDDLCFYVEGSGILDGYCIEIVNTSGEIAGTTVSSVHDIPTEKEGEYFVPLEGDWYLKYSMSY